MPDEMLEEGVLGVLDLFPRMEPEPREEQRKKTLDEQLEFLEAFDPPPYAAPERKY